MFDLIVVGGGPIGLFLAQEFRKKGNSVLVIEKRKSGEGGKVCSGLVSENFFRFVKKDQGFLEKEFSMARIWIGKSKFDFKGKAYLLNRKKLEGFLYQKAKDLGVEVLFGKKVTKIKEKKDFVEVFTQDGDLFQGKLLAGCDGVVSGVGKEVNLPGQKKFLLGVVFYFQKLLSSRKEDNFPQLFFSKEFPGFFTWKIPRKELIEWGTALERKYNPKERLERFLKDNLQLTTNNLQPKSALIPIFPLKKTTTKRVFLCGDSAGQVKSYTGGGLVYGFAGAKMAAKFIEPQSPDLNLYEKGWRRLFGKEIFFGGLIKRSYRLPDFIKKMALWLLQKKKDLDQDRPSTIFKI